MGGASRCAAGTLTCESVSLLLALDKVLVETDRYSGQVPILSRRRVHLVDSTYVATKRI
jgi:hypothetical protein